MTIVHADAFDYMPARGEVFDFVWHDIWDDVCADNLASMTRLVRKYGRRAKKQAVWSREIIRALIRGSAFHPGAGESPAPSHPA